MTLAGGRYVFSFRFGTPRSAVQVIPNGVDTREFYPSLPILLEQALDRSRRTRPYTVLLATRLDPDKRVLFEAVEETWRSLYDAGDGTLGGIPVRWRIAGTGGS
jgi:glycosyltransferase involved in cell wall biosynthesis